MEPPADDNATTEAWNVALEEPELRDLIAEYMNQLERIESGCLKIVDQAVFHDIVNDKAEHHVTDSLSDLMETAIYNTFMSVSNAANNYRNHKI